MQVGTMGVHAGINSSHNFMRDKLANKKIMWAFAFDIFHYIKIPGH